MTVINWNNPQEKITEQKNQDFGGKRQNCFRVITRDKKREKAAVHFLFTC